MITVVRRRRKETKFEKAIGNSRRIGERKSASFLKVLRELDKKEERLKTEAVRRYVKKQGLEKYYQYHDRPWHFSAPGMLYSIEMPAGHFVLEHSVLQLIIAS